jgi:hypothetical protein
MLLDANGRCSIVRLRDLNLFQLTDVCCTESTLSIRPTPVYTDSYGALRRREARQISGPHLLIELCSRPIALHPNTLGRMRPT